MLNIIEKRSFERSSVPSGFVFHYINFLVLVLSAGLDDLI